MRDPRNWVRPAAAVAVGTAAGAALVLFGCAAPAASARGCRAWPIRHGASVSGAIAARARLVGALARPLGAACPWRR